MKTRHIMAGILAIFVLSGYVSGQDPWLPNGSHIYNTNSGNVGIGTDAPGYKLEVAGSIAFSSGVIRWLGSYGTPLQLRTAQGGAIEFYADNNGIGFYTYDGGWVKKVTISDGGSVGIGTTTIPSGYKLAVDGKIIAEEVQVEMSGSWPDHVFADNYRLMPLCEVEAYIHTSRRLPDMPSATEVSENGVSLGEMQAKLLQKVEELTLYVIELQKENEALKERMAELER